MKMKIKTHIFSIILLMFMISCSSPQEKLDKLINRAFNDGKIDHNEKQTIYDFIENRSSEFQQYMTDAKSINIKSIDNYINEKTNTRDNAQEISKSSIDKINVYIDNTGSMNELIGGNTQFQESMNGLITRIENQYNNKLSINAINSNKITVIDGTSSLFVRQPNKKIIKNNKKGTSKSTEILDIITQVIDKISDKQVFILFSDLTSDPPKNPNLQKTTLTHKLSEKIKSTELSTLIINFEGEKKPYYAIIFAKKELLQDIIQHVNIKNITGFADKHGFDMMREEHVISYTVLSESLKKGDFRPNRDFKDESSIRHLKSIDYDAEGILQFVIAADFKPLYSQLGKDYFTDINNYQLLPYTLTKVIDSENENSELAPRDIKESKSKGYSHYLVISINKNIPISDLSIVLKSSLPKWDVNNVNLMYLLNAIAESYKINNNDNDALATININIKVK